MAAVTMAMAVPVAFVMAERPVVLLMFSG